MGALVEVHVTTQKIHRHRIGYVTLVSGAKLMPCAFLCIGPSNILLAVVMHFLYHSTATLLRRCCCNS